MKGPGKLTAVLLTVLAFCLLCAPSVSAAGNGYFSGGYDENGKEITYSHAETEERFKESIITLYKKTARPAALAGGAVGMAVCGCGFFVNGTQEAEKRLRAMLYIILAVAGIFFLPQIIAFGKNLFGAGWDPGSLS